jgi:uncharacterized protein HemX
MDQVPQQSQPIIPEAPPSKVAPWLVAVLIIVLVAGLATWLYLQNGQNKTGQTTTPTTLTTPAVTTTDSSDQAKIDSSLSQLDQELSIISEDNSSTNDNAPDL